jgi:hypothetical protein
MPNEQLTLTLQLPPDSFQLYANAAAVAASLENDLRLYSSNPVVFSDELQSTKAKRARFSLTAVMNSTAEDRSDLLQWVADNSTLVLYGSWQPTYGEVNKQTGYFNWHQACVDTEEQQQAAGG